MLEPADPWHHPRRPGVGDEDAYRPGDHIPLPAVPVAAGWARRRGADALHDRGLRLGPQTVGVVDLLISELVTNALLHGLRAATASGSEARCTQCGGQLCLDLRSSSGAIVIEVFDAALVPPRRTEEVFAQEADGDLDGFTEFTDFTEESGRGLLLVASLSEEQGYYLPRGGGKVVWCIVKAEV